MNLALIVLHSQVRHQAISLHRCISEHMDFMGEAGLINFSRHICSWQGDLRQDHPSLCVFPEATDQHNGSNGVGYDKPQGVILTG